MGVSKDTPAIKFDKLKERFDLIPAKPLRDLAWLYTKGCVKYRDRNWEKGMLWSRVFASTQRHLNKFWQGYTYDGETRIKHVIAAAWGCFALAEYIDTNKSMDDRPRSLNKRALKRKANKEKHHENRHAKSGSLKRKQTHQTGANRRCQKDEV